MRPLMRFRPRFARWITDSQEVGRAVLHCGTGGSVASPATNREIADAAAKYVKARAAAAVL